MPVLTSTAEEMLAMLPAFEQDDPMIVSVIAAQGNECWRIDQSMQMIRAAGFPETADDIVLPTGAVVPLLSMWEANLGLPVNPSGVAVVNRRSLVISTLQALRGGYGSDWKATLSRLLGNSLWSYQEGPGDYEVTIYIPFAAGSWSAAQVIGLARAITPAHLDLIAAYDEGFLLGISEPGEPL